MPHSGSITAVADFDDSKLQPAKNISPVSPFAKQGDLASFTSLESGARVLFATDEWFASADNLLKDSPPLFDPDAYCEQGKVMDG